MSWWHHLPAAFWQSLNTAPSISRLGRSPEWTKPTLHQQLQPLPSLHPRATHSKNNLDPHLALADSQLAPSSQPSWNQKAISQLFCSHRSPRQPPTKVPTALGSRIGLTLADYAGTSLRRSARTNLCLARVACRHWSRHLRLLQTISSTCGRKCLSATRWRSGPIFSPWLAEWTYRHTESRSIQTTQWY